MKNARPSASAATARTTAMSFVVKGAPPPRALSMELAGQRLSHVIDQPVEHAARVTAAVELTVEPGAKARRLPDVLEGELGRSALEAQAEECLGAHAMVDLDPPERVRRRKVDDLDDRFVLGGGALKGDLVAGALAYSILSRRFDGDTAWQPLGHSQRVGNQREDPLDPCRYAGRVRE